MNISFIFKTLSVLKSASVCALYFNSIRKQSKSGSLNKRIFPFAKHAISEIVYTTMVHGLASQCVKLCSIDDIALMCTDASRLDTFSVHVNATIYLYVSKKPARRDVA